jgi:hypothetical protein
MFKLLAESILIVTQKYFCYLKCSSFLNLSDLNYSVDMVKNVCSSTMYKVHRAIPFSLRKCVCENTLIFCVQSNDLAFENIFSFNAHCVGDHRGLRSYSQFVIFKIWDHIIGPLIRLPSCS